MSSESVQPVPAGYHSVTPWIVISGSAKAIAFTLDHELGSRR